MNVEAPGIFLSFDDGWIKEWHDCFPLFREYGVKATFYLSFGVIGGMANVEYRPSPEEWKMLGEIAEQGHTIGYHTWEHLFANNLLQSISHDEYRKREIDPGIEFLAEHGFNRPRHFAYPYGWEACNETTHDCLLKTFDTLRIEVEYKDWELYKPESLRERRLFNSIDIARQETSVFYGYLERIAKEKIIGFFHGHNPEIIKPRLIRIFGYARELEIPFYSIKLLDRMEEGEKNAL